MSPYAQGRILERVQANPEIGQTNAAYIEDLVTRAMSFVVTYCNLSSFPEYPDAVQELEDAAVILVEAMAAKRGVEGLASATLPHGVAFTEAEIDPRAREILRGRRRLWR
ncbi:MAG: hypothetical protein HUU16_00200 [Candidatus Omnitrophica bacterium]|nr:hypothetical protein [bacterium]NUN94570.1 hypothetical protein [Candidatus Omnitrophota bacterium]